MNTGKFRLTVLLMSSSLIGLIFLQVYWIRHDLNVKAQQFDQSVMQAMNTMVDQIEQKENLRFAVQHISSSGDSLLISDYANDSILMALAKVTGAIQPPEPPPAPPEPPVQATELYQELQDRIDEIRDQHREARRMNADGLRIDFDTTLDIRIEKDVQQKEVIAFRLAEESALIDSVAQETEKRMESRLKRLNTMIQKLTFQIGERHGNLFDRINAKDLDTIIRSEFKRRDIGLNFNFGVREFKSNKIIYAKSAADSGSLAESKYSLTLFPNDIIKRNDQLVISFQDKLNYLVWGMWPMLLSSLLFTLVIVLGFAYTVHVILKQKRLASIKNDFINNMTHEFKTPIATIAIANESVRDPRIYSNADKMEYYTAIIRDENLRMLNQVENVLQMAQIDKGELTLRKTETDIKDVILQAISSSKLVIEQREGKVILAAESTKSLVFGDGNHLMNVFTNLLDNANKYSPENPDIAIKVWNDANQIMISVTDKGIGMSKETQKHLFETFYRATTGNIHDVKGFGLGLSYVKAIVEAHHGKIAVNSEYGAGSTFTISLPLI
ncbi:HAMP domain-containing sensor histidine kinase [soil metagenome]